MLRNTGRFLGRTEALEALEAQWRGGARRISIHGMPGMGATALARALIAKLKASFGESDGQSSLRPSKFLLIEQLERFDRSDRSDRAEDREVTQIFTSPRRSWCPPGVQWELGPLDLDDALQLYFQRSGRPESAEARRLVGMLDGWPIAIEGAAERALLRSEQDLLSQQEDLLQTLGLLPLITSMLEALPEEARELLEALSRYSGAFDLKTATLLSRKDTERNLSILRDRGLVLEVPSETSLRLRLPGLLRSHLQPRRGLDPRSYTTWAETLIKEAEQQRSLFYGSTPAGPSAWLRNHLPDLVRLSEDAALSPALNVRAALAAEPLLTTTGSHTASLSLLDHAAMRAQESGDDQLLADTRWALGKIWVTRTCYEESEAALRGAEPLASQIDSVSVATHIYIALGCSLVSRGEIEEARAYLNEALVWAKDDRNHYLRLLTQVQFAFALGFEGQFSEAIDCSIAAEVEATHRNLPRIIALARTSLGWAYKLQGRHLESIGALSLGARIFEQLGETTQMLKLVSWMVGSHAALGATKKAEQLCLRGMRIANAAQDDERELLLLTEIAEVYARSARVEEAQEALIRANLLSRSSVCPQVIQKQSAIAQLLPKPTTIHAPRVRVERNGLWIEGPKGHVDLKRRGAIRRILQRLMSAQLQSPDLPISAKELQSSGWPSSASSEAGQAKVHTAIWTLRTLGLEGVLITDAKGYYLASELTQSVS